MSQLFETFMVVCFGISWPLSILKSLKSRTAKGKSLIFMVFVFIGYLFGISSKFLSGNLTYVVFFYILNLLMVGTDIALYFKNSNLDKKASY